MDKQIDTTMPTWQEMAKVGPRNILTQTQLSPEDPGIAPILIKYVRDIQPFRGDFKNLELEMEKLAHSLRRYRHGLPADADAALKKQTNDIANQNNLHMLAHDWAAEEVDAAKAKAQPATIVAFTWHGARTSDGRELSRESIRQGMRSAAYSDEGWRKY